MSIATEITRLQGIKTDIRTALVTQGIAQASSHNMADFSADILAIQGGSEGVYITVTCARVYQGYDIILSANGSELDRKQCSSSLEVNFFVSADDITLPATFTISNSLNDITKNVTTNIYGWYDGIELVFSLLEECKSKPLAGGSVYNNRVTINEGGYYKDTNTNEVWVYYKLTTKITMDYSEWALITGLPKPTSTIEVINNKEDGNAFHINTNGSVFLNNRGGSAPTLPTGTVLEFYVKYVTA